MRSAFVVMGWLLSAAFTLLACWGLSSVALVPSPAIAGAMLFSAAGFLTIAVVSNPLIHHGHSAVTAARDVTAGLAIAIGFFTLTYLELTGFGFSFG